ncbi:hypothetical protein LMH87_005288 [Akanthomyces muscarius]|uniref:BZIP domain-containing protein n=1 Tax=Akanthomyces muscarius TaxID=2231603 RepID=A0A9W8UP50_AKAMU|nr:hypothetical protein LMH87_005288 [Akanthomyces muscarius]KAJ4163567.1 hypothetical protein LMH87_005288 [Akanthomyces muscarius]
MDDDPGNAEATERARLRRNQRNSRARKQAYIRDLEDRWNECVKLGAQATAEMQAVARKVHEENVLLRRILAHRGFGEDTIERALENERMALGEDDPRVASQRPATLTTVKTRQEDSVPINPCLPAAQLPAETTIGHGLDDTSLGVNHDLSQSAEMYSWLRDLCDIKDAFSLETSYEFADRSWQETATQTDPPILGNERCFDEDHCDLLDLAGTKNTAWPT